MKMIKRVIVALILCGSFLYASDTPGNKIIIDEDIQLLNLGDSVFVHISWASLAQYGRFASNGLLLIRKGRALMVDTPMNNEITRRLVTYLEDSMHVKVTKFIAGHYHDDCIGGLDYLHSKNVKSVASVLTVDKCKQEKLPVPGLSFRDSLLFNFYGEPVECRYFGGGHTADNIVVWLPARKILFGGCLIKSLSAKDLGNSSDASPQEWDLTIDRIIETYKDIEQVVPGHGACGTAELLSHTISLLEKVKNK